MKCNAKKATSLVLGCTLVTGCANMSTGEQVGAAALGCGAVGAIVGLATGSAGIGAAAGGGCFALGAAAIAVNYYDQQSRSVEQDQQMYGYSLNEVKESTVQIRQVHSAPTSVRPGEKLSIVTDYSVITPQDQAGQEVQVEESMTLMSMDGSDSKPLKPRTIARKAGGWDSTVNITIPDGMPAGKYVVEHKVQAGSSYAVEKSTFVVADA